MQTESKLRAVVRICRPEQWTKNLIVWAPILFAKKITEPELCIKVAACMVAMCAMSSTVYVLNDLIDRDADRLHPTKKERPIAKGIIGPGLAVALATTLVLIAVTIGAIIRPSLLLVIGAYLGIMLLYVTRLKKYPLLDVCCISAGFVLRAVAGGAAVYVPISAWFLICTSLGSLFLALEKRRQELVVLDQLAQSHRATLAHYTPEMLNRIEGLILPSLLTCYAIYSFQSVNGPLMLLTLPFVVFGLMRYQMLSTVSTTTASPEKVLLTDRPLQITIILWLLTASIVVYDVLPSIFHNLVADIDSFAVFK
ncbi:MAG: decaprenyl-phosphate phosphoribosyltransferase [Candidatus Obscuribacterales bacterium]|nr:decaprenyl-phosphate phosphoribosyltransferase [Candidatus Obscuribacterales bacterium]